MPSINRLIFRFLLNPASLRFSQIERILLHFGCQTIQGKGSHVKFKHPLFPRLLIFPIHNNDCLNHYKKDAADFIEILFIKPKNNGKRIDH